MLGSLDAGAAWSPPTNVAAVLHSSLGCWWYSTFDVQPEGKLYLAPTDRVQIW
jgi:predicted metalloendopeptidase